MQGLPDNITYLDLLTFLFHLYLIFYLLWLLPFLSCHVMQGPPDTITSFDDLLTFLFCLYSFFYTLSSICLDFTIPEPPLLPWSFICPVTQGPPDTMTSLDARRGLTTTCKRMIDGNRAGRSGLLASTSQEARVRFAVTFPLAYGT